MVYVKGKICLSSNQKNQAGCRVLLNRVDLMKLQYLECTVFETITRKSAIVRPAVLKQFETMSNYLDQEFTKVCNDSVISNISKNDKFLRKFLINEIISSGVFGGESTLVN